MLFDRKNTRQFLGLKGLGECTLVTDGGDAAFFILQPTNLSVLSKDAATRQIMRLMGILKAIGECELLALDSCESFDDTKRYLSERESKEQNPALCELLRKDEEYLNQIQVQTATARRFLLCVHLHGKSGKQIYPFLGRIEKLIREQQFSVCRADREDIKRMLAVYFTQNKAGGHLDEFDGERVVNAYGAK